MRHRRDWLVPIGAFVALLLVGVLIVALLSEAERSGRSALEDSLTAEVDAQATSQAQSVGSGLQTITGFLAGRDLELTVDSEADRAEFQDIADLLDEAGLRTGFFFTDASGVVTQGFQLEDRDVIGEPLERPGFAQVLPLLDAREVTAIPLPAAPGITTEVPTTAVLAGVFDEETEELRGTFVLESEVSPDSNQSQQFAALGRGETGEYLLFETQTGTVVAATDPSLVARPVPDATYATLDDGLHRLDDQVVVVADIGRFGQRLAYRQDIDEFEEGLSGPLQRAGGIVVAAFLILGAITFIALARRLAAAREEQARLRQLNESQEEFISIVSHELRTPVAGVLGFLQTTIDHWDEMTDGERSGAVLRAASNARRLQGLTRDVLDSQSVESGRMTYAMSPGDLQEEVDVAVEAARVLYPNQRFDLMCDTAEAQVQMDADRIQQVLTNLVDNAVRVSPPQRPIELRLWIEDGKARVSVHDSGPGLPPDLTSRVFEKFVRGRGSSVSGTGLGLYISRQILEAHGGSIWVESTPGEGATFTIELPLSEVRVPS